MKHDGRIRADGYTDIPYHQFSQSTAMRWGMTIAGVLTWPITLPLAFLSRLSDFVFLTCSQIFALVPYLFGIIVRYEFYRFSLASCGRNVNIGFGTVFLYRDISIGNNVLFGMYNTVHHCDVGDYVLIADGCRFLSGSQYHRFDRTDIPMALQGGRLKRITLSDDVWVGTNAVVMANVGQGAVIAAGSVVVDDVADYDVAGGVPAKRLKSRNSSSDTQA